LHPSGNEAQKKLELYLDSLEYTGELKKIDYQYVVTGLGVATIEKYEKEDRKHAEFVTLQRILVALTFFLVIVGLLQAGVIKLPTLIDLSH
jgi:hypothetical protein